MDFSLCQSSTNHSLLQKICIYLGNLPDSRPAIGGKEVSTEANYVDALGISKVISNNPNQQSTTRIETTRIPYITNIFIPFLESLT